MSTATSGDDMNIPEGSNEKTDDVALQESSLSHSNEIKGTGRTSKIEEITRDLERLQVDANEELGDVDGPPEVLESEVETARKKINESVNDEHTLELQHPLDEPIIAKKVKVQSKDAENNEDYDSDMSLSAYADPVEKTTVISTLEDGPLKDPSTDKQEGETNHSDTIRYSDATETTPRNLEHDRPPPLPSRTNVENLNEGLLQKGPVHAVPPPLAEEQKSEVFQKNVAILKLKSVPPAVPPRSSHKRSGSADFDLVISRFQDNEDEYLSKDDITQENLQEGARLLKSSFTAFLETIEPDHDLPQDHEEHRELVTTDWPFWTRLVSNYAEVAKKDSTKLEQEVASGIPPQIRGIIWQLLASAKSKEIDEVYASLMDIESQHERPIERDLSRTNFIPQDKVKSLFQVLKAYSLYDTEVGYTQGMAFIATPLLLNVESESEAFGLLISLMKGYGLRELFLPNMPGLHLKLYQFDRLIEENSPMLYNHLVRQGVRSSMYASQWFLTCFAYRFPLCFVLRILDVVFAEGIEAILKFAAVLMIRNEKTLLTLQFDQLLEFLKGELFAYYLKSSVKKRQQSKVFKGDSNSAFSLLHKISSSSESHQSKDEISDEDYAIDAFIEDAMLEIKITPISLKRYCAEYDEIHLLESQKEAQFESLRIKNRQLQNEVRKLERDHTVLNREHIGIANELIENRLAFETLQDENRDLKTDVIRIKAQLQEEIRKQSLPNPDAEIPTDLRADLQETMVRNLEVMNANQELQERVVRLERELSSLKHASFHTTSAGKSGNWKTLRKVWK
ncbi:LANO_0E02630g1_1 [Lachancea nothofagi CBS 11611]|uniref:GTPase-activating protein GYP5 n=1 Tax=Lachancea nothofagi CBS 11611 TaxID=1266666 RepID=A0A1G4JQ99_9SACH|nr:LANO_0E02630g1_1 [Lachancea nothofagi CBS 11611]